MFCRCCLCIVGFVLLYLQFYVYVLQMLFVYSRVRVTRSLVLCVCFVDVVCVQQGSCYSIFSFMCMFCRCCLCIVGFVLLYLQFYVYVLQMLFVYSGVRVTRSLVLCVCFVDVVCVQQGSCYSIFSFMCMFCRCCLCIVGFVLLDLQFYVYVLQMLFVYSRVCVTRSLVLCVCFVDVVCVQWGSCYQIFSFMCMFCRCCLCIVGFVLLDLQFYVYVLQMLFVYSGVRVTLSLVLCVCFVDVVCVQQGSCYSIFSFMCMFCRCCLCIVGFVLLYLQFYVYVLQMLFVYSGVRVTLSLVLCVCFVDVVCVQWGSCYSIFSFMCMFCRCCLCIVGFVLLDLQFYVYVLQMLFVYSGVRVTRSLVLCVCFVDVVCVQWGSCYLIFSFMCMFCRCCLCIVGFVLLYLQFYVYVLQMLFVYSGVRVTRSLVLCVCFVDVVCVQYVLGCLCQGSCYSIFSFMCMFCRCCLCIVGFVLLDLQFYVYVLQMLFVYSGVRVTLSLVLCVCFVDVVCVQWGSCYSIFSFMCMFCRCCLCIVGFVLLDLQFYVYVLQMLFVYSGVRVTRSLVLCVCFVDVVCVQQGLCYSIFSFMCMFCRCCLCIVGFVLLDLQFYVYVLQMLFVYSGVCVTRSLVLCVCFVDVVCVQWGSCYSIFSFMCMFCRCCLCIVGFVLLDLQFYVYVLQMLFVYSGVRVTRSLVLCVCFVDVVCVQWGSCYSIFSFMCMFCRCCLCIVGFVLLDLQFYVYVLQMLFVYSGVRVTRSLVLCVCFVDVVCVQWGSCYSIFSFMCMFCRCCLCIVGFVLLDLQFYVYVLQMLFVYSGVRVTRSLVLCVCFVDVVCVQWGSCYSIFSFMCMFCRCCLCIVGFVLLYLQFYVYVLQMLFVYSGVCVTRSLVLCVCFVDVVCVQWGSCYQIFSFMCMFCRCCLCIVGFVLLDLQFYVYVLQMLFVYSGVRVTRSLVLCVCFVDVVCVQQGLCYQIFSFMCMFCRCCLCQWGSCYQIFSFMCMFCRCCLCIVGFVLLDLQFYVYVLQMLFVYSRVRVTRSLVLCVCFVDVVCVQWGSCYSIFSFMCMFCRCCLCIVGFVLLYLQFYVYVLQMLFVYSRVRVTRSLVLCVCFVDVVCVQWGSCYQIFSFMCMFCRCCLCIVGFVLLDLQFYVYVLQMLFVYSRVCVTRSLVLCVCFVDVVCVQWGSCYSIFSFMCMFCRCCLCIVGFVLLDLQFYVYVLQMLFVYSRVRVTRSLVLCVCFVDVVCVQWGSCYSIFSFMCMFCRCCLCIVGFVLLDLQFYVYVLQMLFVYSGVRVTRSLVLCVCFVDVVCVQWGSCYQIFSFMCMFCRCCLCIVGFVLLDLQFYVYVLQMLFVYSGVRVTRSLVLCVCFVDVVCVQWGLCYSIFSFMCMFCRCCLCIVGFVLLDLQFYVYVLQMLFVYSGVRVTLSLVLCVCFVDVVCVQQGSCYSIFSFMCMFCRCCLCIVGFVLLYLQFYVYVLQMLFVYSRVRVTRSLVLCVCFVDVVCVQWGSCYSIFSFMCMFCRCCLCIVGFVLLYLQFYVYVLQMLFVYSRVRVTRSLVLCVCFVDVVCVQWGSCYSIFSFMCMFCRCCLCIVGFVLLDLQFYVYVLQMLFVYSGVRVTRSLVLCVCFVDVVCVQWGSCYSIFSFMCMFCRCCLCIVGFVLLYLQFYVYVLQMLFVYSGVRVTLSLVLCVCFVDVVCVQWGSCYSIFSFMCMFCRCCLCIVGFVLLDLQFYVYVLQMLFVYSGVRVTLSLVLCVCFVDVVCVQWGSCYSIFSFMCMFCRCCLCIVGLCYSIFSFMCMFCRCCLCIVGFVLLDLQFYVYVLQMLFVYSGVRVTRSLVLCVCFVDVVCVQWGSCYSIFSFMCMFCRCCLCIVGFVLLDLQFYVYVLQMLFVYSGVCVTRSLVLCVCFVDVVCAQWGCVTRSLVLCVCFVDVVCVQWGSCYQIFSFMCMFCRCCLCIVGFVLLDLQFYVYVLQMLFVYSGVRVTRSLVLCVCFVDVVCVQWGSCYSIFSFMCMFCRCCLCIVGFVLLDLQFYVYVLQMLFVYSGVRVTRSLVLCVCFVDVVCVQWGSCYSIFSFMCMFCRCCLCIVGFVLLDLQFYVYVLQMLFVYSGVRVTRSLVLCVCFVDVVCVQWGSCYSIFSFMCMFCRCCLCIVGFVLLDLQFYVYVLQMLFVYSGVRVTRSLVLCVCFVDVVCVQWGSCYSIFSFMCMFCRCCLCIVGFVLLDLQFYVYVLQMLFVYSGVRVTRSLVLCVCFVDVVCVQWGLCYSIFSFMCMFCRCCLCIVGFVLLDLQFYVYVLQMLFVYSGVRVTRSLVLCVCFVDVVCVQWGSCYSIFSFMCMFCRCCLCIVGLCYSIFSFMCMFCRCCLCIVGLCYSIFSFMCMFCRCCLCIVGFVLLDLQFYVYVLQMLFVYSGVRVTRSLVLCVCFVDVVCVQWGSCYSIFSFMCMFCRCCLCIVGFVLLDLQFYVYVLQMLFVYSGVRVTRSLVLCVCFVDVVCVQWGSCYSIFSFMCMFCRCCLCIVGFVLLDIQFYVYVLQMLFVYSGVRVTRSLVLCVCFVDVVCVQWGSCYSIFSFMCMFCRCCLCIVGFVLLDLQFYVYVLQMLFVYSGVVLLDLQFYVYVLQMLFVYSGVRVTRSLVLCVCFVDVVCVQWGCVTRSLVLCVCFVDVVCVQWGCVTRSLVLCVCFVDVVCVQWGLCYSIFSFMCMFCRCCLCIVGFVLLDIQFYVYVLQMLFVYSGVVLLDLQFYVYVLQMLFVYSGVRVTRSLVLCVCFVDVVCVQWGLCYSIFSFMCMFCRCCLCIVGLCYSIFSFMCMFCRCCLCIVGLCYSIFSFMCMFCRCCLCIVGFVLLDLQFYVYVLQMLFVYSGVRVTRSLVLCVCFVDVVCVQWGSCYSIFSFMCMFCRCCLCIVGFVLLDLQFYVYVLQMLFVYSGVVLLDIQFYVYVLQMLFVYSGVVLLDIQFYVYVLQMLFVYSGVVLLDIQFYVYVLQMLFVYSGVVLLDIQFYVYVLQMLFVYSGVVLLDIQFYVYVLQMLFVYSGVVLLDIQFYVYVLQMLFVYSGVRVTRYLVLCVCFVDVVCVQWGCVTRYLVLCVCFVDVVCVQWGSCYSIFSFMCMFCRCCLCIVGFVLLDLQFYVYVLQMLFVYSGVVLLDLQFYVYVLQMLFVYSGVRVTRSLVLCVCFVDVVCVQWGSCYSIFSFMCMFCRCCLCIVGFVLLDIQFYVYVLQMLFVYSGVRVTRSLVLCVCFVDVVCVQWGSCYSIFSFMCMFCRCCLCIVGLCYSIFSFMCMFCRCCLCIVGLCYSIFSFMCMFCRCCLCIVGLVLLDIQFYVYVLQMLFVYSGVRVTRSLVLCVCFVDVVCVQWGCVTRSLVLCVCFVDVVCVQWGSCYSIFSFMCMFCRCCLCIVGLCYSIFSFMCMFCRCCLCIVGFVLLDLQFYVYVLQMLFVYSGVVLLDLQFYVYVLQMLFVYSGVRVTRSLVLCVCFVDVVCVQWGCVTRSLVLCVCFVDVVCVQWGSCYSIFSFMCMFCRCCLCIVGFVLLDLQFYVYVLQMLFVYSGVRVTRSLVLCVCFVDVVCVQWGSCYSIFSFMCMFCRCCLCIVGFVLLDLQFYVYVLQMLFVYSGVCVTRSLVLCVCFVDVVCVQWGSCYSIFSFMCMFCRCCLCIVGFVLLDLQFYVYVLQMLFVYSGVRVTRSLVLCVCFVDVVCVQWGLCYSIFSFMCMFCRCCLCIVGLCYSIFSFMCMFCRCCLCIVGFVLLDLQFYVYVLQMLFVYSGVVLLDIQFYVYVLQMLFVYSGVRVTRSLVLCVCFVDVVCVQWGCVTRYLVLCVCFVDVVCVQWGLCYSIFSFMCMFCRCCLCIVGFVLLDLQFYVYVLQMLFVYSGVRVTRSLVLCVCFVDVVCVQWGCVTRYLVLCVCFVDVVCVQWGCVTRYLVLCVCFVDVVCVQWGLCYSIFSFMCMFCRCCLCIVGFVLLDLQFYVYVLQMLFVYSGVCVTRSLVLCVCFVDVVCVQWGLCYSIFSFMCMFCRCCLCIVGFVLLDLQFYVYVLQMLFVYSGVRVTRSLVLCVCFVDVVCVTRSLVLVFCRLFVYSGVRVTRSLVLCVCFVDVVCVQWGCVTRSLVLCVCFVDVVCVQWGSCYSIFSFMCMFCRCCLCIVGFVLLDLQFYVYVLQMLFVYSGVVLLDLQFYVYVLQMLFVYSGVRVTRSLVLCVCFVDVVCVQWGSCYSIFSFMCMFCRCCLCIVGFVLLDLQFYVYVLQMLFVYSGVRVTRSLVLCVCFVDVVCVQWGSCYSIFSFMCMFCRCCLCIVGLCYSIFSFMCMFCRCCLCIVGFVLLDLQFYVYVLQMLFVYSGVVLLDLQFYVYVLQMLFVYSGVRVTRSLVLCVCFVDVVCVQWGLCYSIFSFMCMFCRCCLCIVGFVLLDLQFYVYVLQMLFVYSGVRVTRSLVLCVCFVDVVCVQWGSCYSIFSFMCMFCRCCLCIVGFVLLDLQFYVYVLQMLFVYSGVRVTRSLVLCVCFVDVVCVQWGLCYSIFSFMCMFCRCCLCIVGLCYSIFSFMCMFCRCCLCIVGFVLLDLQFYVYVLQMLFVYSGVRVTRSLVLCVCFVDVVCVQWGSCYSIFSFMCMFCRCCLCIVGFVLLDLQFYVYVLQMLFVYSGVRVTRSLVLCVCFVDVVCVQWGCVTRSLVLCVCFVDVVCVQWGSCYSIFSFMCMFCRCCLCIVGFVLLDLQFYVYVLQMLFVYSGVRVTRSLVLCVCFVDVVCVQWGSCYSIFSFMCMFCRCCLCIVGFVLLDLQFYVYVLQMLFVYSGVVLLDLQFYVYVLQMLFVYVLYVVCVQQGSCYSIFSFMCMFCRCCLCIVGFVLLDLQFYVYVLQMLFVYSGGVTRSLVLCVCFVDVVCVTCYSIFSFMCMFCRCCLCIVGFVLLDLQFYVYVLQMLFVYSGVCVTRSLVLCVCFVDVVCVQWGSCYSIFSFMCMFCRCCLCIVGLCYSIFSFMCMFCRCCLCIVGFVLLDLQFYVYVLQMLFVYSGVVLLDLQFYVYVLQMLFVYSGVRVTRSLVLCVCFVDVVCVQWGSCYSIFSFMCMFCRCCLCIVGFVLLDLQFYVYVLQMLFVYSGVRVTRSLVLCVCFVDVVCVQWGSCYSIFSFMCMFCRCCLCIVGFVLLDLQFYVYVLQMLFVYSGVRVTRSLVLCVCFVDVVCVQWGLCYSIFSFMCMFCRCCLCIVGFVLLDLQFYVYVLQMLFVYSGVRVTRSLVLCVCFVFVYSGVRVTRSLVLCVCFVDVVCVQWGSCYSIFSFMCMFCRCCLCIVGFVLLYLQFYVYVLQMLFVYSEGFFSFMCMLCRCCLCQVRVTRSLVLCVCFVDVVCVQ